MSPVKVPFSGGSVEVQENLSEMDQVAWRAGMASYACDHRYYEVVHQTLEQQFQHLHLVVRGLDGETRAVQPALIVRQDMLMGMPERARRLVDRWRRHAPGLFKLPMLMIGCSAGEGDLAVDTLTGSTFFTARALQETLLRVARACRVMMVVFKDFPAGYRADLDQLKMAGFTRIPSMPATRLALEFTSFDHYLESKLSHAMRKNLRRKFRKGSSDIRFEVTNQVADIIDEVFPLYHAVFARAGQKFEELTPDYFIRLGRDLPDRAKFFVWRKDGKIVAFASCIVFEGVLRDNYIGLDYTLAFEESLYFITWRDTIIWALENDLKLYHSAPLNYDPKLHFRMELDPLDLYVRATNPILNRVFAPFLDWLEPTRYDKAVQKFPNVASLR